MRLYLNDEEVDEVLSKMFNSVGREFISIKKSCKDEKWFMKASWTQAQEAEFEKWLKQYVMNKLGISARFAEQKVKMFCFNYGWKYRRTNAKNEL